MAEPRPSWAMARRALLLALLALSGTAQAMPVIDDRGAALNLARAPQRIVTLLPALAETVCELGACDRLVGVDQYSNWPDAVRKLPRVGDVDEVRLETILSLKPDVVLLSATSRSIARLESLGIPVFGVELKTLADVRRTQAQVAQLLQLA
ncbi:MAG: ABC transporter substrate-binding protein, partial [Ramlibacter sp.]